MVKKLLSPILVFLLFLFGCSVKEKEKWQTSTFLYFDTLCQINVFCLPSSFESCKEEVHRVFTKIEAPFSPGSRDSSSPLVLDLYRTAFKIYQDSDGCFDITVAPLSRLWGFFNKSFRLPTPDEIKIQLKYIGMDKIGVEGGRLILPPGMEIDWGGIAKGLGVDLVYQSLRSMGIQRGFINAGGDLFCWGKNPDNQSWKIGIEHPRKSGLLGALSISDLGAATTGDYQRYFERNGARYHHVFNPSTGYPARGKQSVTVIGPKTVVCDALSTALFVSEAPKEILRRYPEYGAIIVFSGEKVLRLGKEYLFRLY